MQPAKHAKRYLPTLTEIVHPHAASVVPVVGSEQMVERVMQRVLPAVEAELRDMLHRQAQEQVRVLMPQLQQEIEALVRRELAENRPPDR